MTAGDGPVRSTRPAKPTLAERNEARVDTITRAEQAKAPTAAQLTEMVARLTGELAQAHDDASTLTAERDEARGQLRVAEGDQEAAEQRIKTLEVRLEAADAQRAKVVQQYEKARDYGTRVTAELADATKARDDMAAEVERKVADLDEQVDRIEAEGKRLAAERDGYRRERDELERRLHAARDEADGYMRERDNAVNAHKDLTTIHDDLHNRVSRLLDERSAYQTALAADVGHARKQVQATRATLGSRRARKAAKVRRSHAREQHYAAKARLTALEAVAGRWQA